MRGGLVGSCVCLTERGRGREKERERAEEREREARTRLGEAPEPDDPVEAVESDRWSLAAFIPDDSMLAAVCWGRVFSWSRLLVETGAE